MYLNRWVITWHQVGHYLVSGGSLPFIRLVITIYLGHYHVSGGSFPGIWVITMYLGHYLVSGSEQVGHYLLSGSLHVSGSLPCIRWVITMYQVFHYHVSGGSLPCIWVITWYLGHYLVSGSEQAAQVGQDPIHTEEGGAVLLLLKTTAVQSVLKRRPPQYRPY